MHVPIQICYTVSRCPEQFVGQDYKSNNSSDIRLKVEYSISLPPYVHTTWNWQKASVYWLIYNPGINCLPPKNRFTGRNPWQYHVIYHFLDGGKFYWFEDSADIKTSGTSNSCHYKHHCSPNQCWAVVESMISHFYVRNKFLSCSSDEVECKTVQRRRKQSWTMWKDWLRYSM